MELKKIVRKNNLSQFISGIVFFIVGILLLGAPDWPELSWGQIFFLIGVVNILDSVGDSIFGKNIY